MQQSNQRAHKSEPTETRTAGSAASRDSPERSTNEKSDSRGGASRTGRIQIGRPSATRTEGRDGENSRGAVPQTPSRDNTAESCTTTDGDDGPDHITPCTCPEHTGVCEACGFKITVAASGREYGHARATNSAYTVDGVRYDCPHRPDECDPNGKRVVEGDSEGYPLADGGTVLACPECDFTGIRSMVRSGFGVSADHDNDYYCRRCGASFDEPEEREPKDESGLPGLAGDLDEMDADDVGQPVPDGGLTDTKAAALVEEVQHSADGAFTHDEQTKLDAVVDYLRSGTALVDEDVVTDDRIEAASKLRCIADDLERLSRQSTADDTDVSVHVSVDETYRYDGGDE